MANTEAQKAYFKAYYQANKEKLKADEKGRREADPEAYNARQRERRAANPDKCREHEKTKRARHGDKMLERQRARAAANKVAGIERKRNKEKDKAWRQRIEAERIALGIARKRDPARGRMYANNRRAAKISATPAWADSDKIAAIYAECDVMTKSTGIPYEVDHIVPLKGKNVCGLHVHYNMQILTQHENRTKYTSLSLAA